MKKSAFNPQHQLENIDSKIIVAFDRIAQAYRSLLWEKSTEFALSPIQIQVIIFLNNHSSTKCKVSYLAEEFNVSKASISDTIKVLEQKNLIYKQVEEYDARSYFIGLTKEGKSIANKTSNFADQILSSVTELQDHQKEGLFSSLIQIIHFLNQAGVLTVQRMCLNCQNHSFNEKDQFHYCKLLKSKLKNSELRVDCNEHILDAV